MLSGARSRSEDPNLDDRDDDHDTGGERRGGGSRAPHAALLLSLFLVVAIGLTFPNVTRLRTYIAGDSGDSLLNLWIIRRVEIGLPHGWHGFWNTPIFYPAHSTLAYSDTLLPVALVHWPLRFFLGDVLAMNVIYLGSWVVSSWCVYRLASRFVRHWGAALVASLAYTYSATRLTHHGHFQLVVGGALVPLVLLLLLRLFDDPSVGRGLALGASFAALTLSASYFGAMTAIVVVIVAGGLLLARRPGALRPYVVALGAAAAVVVVFVAPIGAKYAQFQRDPAFRRSFEPETATHLGDLAATGVHNYLLEHVGFIEHGVASECAGHRESDVPRRRRDRVRRRRRRAGRVRGRLPTAAAQAGRTRTRVGPDRGRGRCRARVVDR